MVTYFPKNYVSFSKVPEEPLHFTVKAMLALANHNFSTSCFPNDHRCHVSTDCEIKNGIIDLVDHCRNIGYEIQKAMTRIEIEFKRERYLKYVDRLVFVTYPPEKGELFITADFQRAFEEQWQQFWKFVQEATP